jgi:hypothetical protein
VEDCDRFCFLGWDVTLALRSGLASFMGSTLPGLGKLEFRASWIADGKHRWREVRTTKELRMAQGANALNSSGVRVPKIGTVALPSLELTS